MIRFALMGAGRMGLRHAENIHEEKGMELRAVCDPSPKAARLASKLTKARLETVQGVLGAKDIDALIIASPAAATPNRQLPAQRRARLFSAKSRLQQTWPRSAGWWPQQSVPALSRWPGFNRRLDESFVLLRKQVMAGKVGKVEMLRLTSRSDVPPSPAYAKLSGGIMRDKGAHFFDLACWLAGASPKSVYATGGNLFDRGLKKVGDLDTAMLVLELDGGTLCQFDFSRRTAYGQDERVEVFGSKGRIEFSMEPKGQVEMTTARGSASVSNPKGQWHAQYEKTYRAEIKEFAEALREKRKCRYPLRQALWQKRSQQLR